MFIRDAAAATSHDVTPEGFLRVRARIGRTGLHDYRAEELGNPVGFRPGQTVRVYRSPEEVFDPASMASFQAKPVTDDHPPQMVDARNWKRYAIGHSGHDVSRDGDHLATDLLIADAGAAGRALAGAELSNGYHADFVFAAGTTPDGDPFDAVQRNIRGNHIALVEAGRCGGSCRIGDPSSDCACEPTENAAPAATTPPAIDPPRETDAALLDAMVQDRTAVIETLRRLVGASVDTAGRRTADLRRLVVARRLGEHRVRDRGDAYVEAAFDTLAAMQPSGNPLAAHLSTGLRDAGTGRAASLASRNRYLTHAWKGEPIEGDR